MGTKERAIALEYTKTKKDSAKAKAWADVKAKIEVAKTDSTSAYSAINTYTTDITALENTIAGMPTGTDAEKAAKATKVKAKDDKVKLKKTKQKERIEGQRTAAKDAFKSGLGVDAIDDEELEEMLKETSKMEMSKNLDACYDIAMTKDASAMKGYLSNCRKEAMKTAKDARMPKKGSIEEVLETAIAGDIAEIAALDTEIEGMDAGTAKDAKVAAKATKEAEKLT